MGLVLVDDDDDDDDDNSCKWNMSGWLWMTN